MVLASHRAGMILDVAPGRAPLQISDRLELGARVNYTHRAAVVRWKPQVGTDHAQWLPVEGCERGWRPTIDPQPPRPDAIFFHGFGDERDVFWTDAPAVGHPNKNVVVWPDLGGGVVIGLVRRGIGYSWGPSGRTGLFDDSYEPGGFAAAAYVWLYMIKWQLEGKFYGLVPHWAIVP